MRYKVLITISGETHEVFTMADSEYRAMCNAASRIAKKIGKTIRYVWDIMLYKSHSFEVKQV